MPKRTNDRLKGVAEQQKQQLVRQLETLENDIWNVDDLEQANLALEVLVTTLAKLGSTPIQGKLSVGEYLGTLQGLDKRASELAQEIERILADEIYDDQAEESSIAAAEKARSELHPLLTEYVDTLWPDDD